jgi:hypothetical protein
LDFVSEYLENFSQLGKDYFDAYAYDTIWSLAYLYRSQLVSNLSNTEIFKKAIENIDFIGATVSEVKAKEFCYYC